ncbi:MAG: hypothetical protein K5871_03180 [Lachnospiraceae bacterium]|nr:hypothetical protein [Lachnospiraceae bacterium]
MNSENKFFDKALSDMKDSFAGRDGIKHLAGLGYSMHEIQSSLDFPFPIEKIGKILWDHYVSTETILLKAPGSGSGTVNSTYVKKTDAYGKQSFIKVTGEKDNLPDLTWKKVVFRNEHDIFQTPFMNENGRIREFISENTSGGPDYVSLDLGRLKSRGGNEWSVLLSLLGDEEREYAEYMPWENSLTSVYHRIDERIIRMLCRLEKTGFMPGVYYFALRDV